MNTLGKLVLGAMGALRPAPVLGSTARRVIDLPAVQHDLKAPLMQALAQRCSTRAYRKDALDPQVLSNLLWAAWGVNRQEGGRTAPSALNAQEILLYLAMADGAYLYDASSHQLRLAAGVDLRRVTGYQDFVDEAPVDLVYVADHTRMRLVPVAHREAYACVAAGAIAQNVYLACAASGVGTVLRAWIDREAIAQALGLPHEQQVLLSQTVGYAS